MKFLSVVICALFVFLSTTLSAAEPTNNNKYGESSKFGLGVGVSSRKISFVVQENGDSTEKARFEEDDITPFLILTSPDFFYDSWTSWAMGIEVGYTQFDLKTQYDSLDRALNLGTSVKGKYTYAMVVFSLHSDDKHADPSDENGFILGLGAGLAYLQASGNVVYTGTDYTTHNIDVNGIGPILALTGEYRNSGFFVRIHVLATGAGEEQNNDLDTADNSYIVAEAAVNLGYAIYF